MKSFIFLIGDKGKFNDAHNIIKYLQRNGQKKLVNNLSKKIW